MSNRKLLDTNQHASLGWMGEYVVPEAPFNQAPEDDPLRILWPAESSRSLG
jgi:hypothetical protein